MSSEDMLCTPAGVRKWLDIDLPEDADGMIEQAILIGSDLARDLGDPRWTDATVPAPVTRVIEAAVARYVRNPDGYTQSRSADEGLGWMDNPDAGTVYFTEAEEQRILRHAGVVKGGLVSVGVYAHQRPGGKTLGDQWQSDEDGHLIDWPENDWRYRWRR